MRYKEPPVGTLLRVRYESGGWWIWQRTGDDADSWYAVGAVRNRDWTYVLDGAISVDQAEWMPALFEYV